MDANVLLVEDDASIRETTAMGLRGAGFRVASSGDGQEALDQFRRERFDLVVLDVMLPTLDGFEVCREIRNQSRVPIVMLTARSDPTDIVVGLELGADDYITKPFDMPVLVARARSVLRRAKVEPEEEVLQIAGLEIDPGAFTVWKADAEIRLTATEFRLLLELAHRPGQVFTRELLLEKVWGYDYLGDSRLVDVAIQRLRSKIEDDPSHPELITTVRGAGYRFARSRR